VSGEEVAMSSDSMSSSPKEAAEKIESNSLLEMFIESSSIQTIFSNELIVLKERIRLPLEAVEGIGRGELVGEEGCSMNSYCLGSYRLRPRPLTT